jgi:hypothetical protein
MLPKYILPLWVGMHDRLERIGYESGARMEDGAANARDACTCFVAYLVKRQTTRSGFVIPSHNQLGVFKQVLRTEHQF